jgi:hypothetical protein
MSTPKLHALNNHTLPLFAEQCDQEHILYRANFSADGPPLDFPLVSCSCSLSSTHLTAQVRASFRASAAQPSHLTLIASGSPFIAMFLGLLKSALHYTRVRQVPLYSIASAASASTHLVLSSSSLRLVLGAMLTLHNCCSSFHVRRPFTVRYRSETTRDVK